MLAFPHPQSSTVFISPKQKLSHSVGYSGFIFIQERTVRIRVVPVTYSSATDKALHDPGHDLGSSIWRRCLFWSRLWCASCGTTTLSKSEVFLNSSFLGQLFVQTSWADRASRAIAELTQQGRSQDSLVPGASTCAGAGGSSRHCCRVISAVLCFLLMSVWVSGLGAAPCWVGAGAAETSNCFSYVALWRVSANPSPFPPPESGFCCLFVCLLIPNLPTA